MPLSVYTWSREQTLVSPRPVVCARMSQNPRKIVFRMPALLSEPASERAEHRPAVTPAGDPVSPDLTEARKLGTIMEVSEALTGTLNLQAGFYGVLEVL